MQDFTQDPEVCLSQIRKDSIGDEGYNRSFEQHQCVRRITEHFRAPDRHLQIRSVNFRSMPPMTHLLLADIPTTTCWPICEIFFMNASAQSSKKVYKAVLTLTLATEDLDRCGKVARHTYLILQTCSALACLDHCFAVFLAL